MSLQKVLYLTLLATLARCEPPVQNFGYNYQAPRQNSYNSGFNAQNRGIGIPSTGYGVPNTGYGAPNTGYGAPNTGYGAPNTGFGSHGSGYDNYDNGHGHGHDNEVPKSYEFGYSVKDALSGNDYDRKEVSDGNTVRGEYRVQLPDGRVQIVNYHADWRTGFHADVRYEGEAKYPEYTNARPSDSYGPPQDSYNYNAPSDFSGSLTGFHGAGNQGFKRPSTNYGPPGYH